MSSANVLQTQFALKIVRARKSLGEWNPTIDNKSLELIIRCEQAKLRCDDLLQREERKKLKRGL